MNITQKFGFLAAIALLLLGGGSAFAQRFDNNYNSSTIYRESFEDLTAWGGYTNVNITNGWYSTPDDQSMITNLVYTPPACGYFTNSITHTNVLRLNTEGATLTNDFTFNARNNTGIDLSGNVTYMDMMIQFVASEVPPATCITQGPSDSDAGIKAAVFADVNTNLAIYCGVCNQAGNTLSNAIINSGTQLDATNWYRLTIEFDGTYSNNRLGKYPKTFPVFRVRLNGAIITNNNGYAYDDNWKTEILSNGNLPPLTPSSVGTWFPSATHNLQALQLTGIAFQGTGYIDDLIVTNANLWPVVGPSYFYMTVVNSSGHGSIYTNGISILAGSGSVNVQIASGATPSVVYQADDWYRVNTLRATDGSYVTGVTNQIAYTQTLGAVTANFTNTVSFYAPDGGVINSAYTGVPASWLAGWNPSESTTTNGIGLSVHQQYLLGINPFIDETVNFSVTAIAVTNSTVDVSVSLTANAAAVASTVNGTLYLYGATNLPVAAGSATYTNITPLQSLGNGNATSTFQFTSTDSNMFYTATIQ